MRRRSMTMALLAVLWLAAQVEPAQALPATQTTVSVDGDTIRIKAFIEIFGGRASEALAAVIEAQINGIWQDPHNQHTYCGMKVEFEAEVRAGRGTGGWHQIRVANNRPGQYYRSWVRTIRDPYSRDIGGKWTSLGGPPDLVYAHEAGHLFGAPDEYVDTSSGGSTTNPGRDRTLMADNSHFIDSTVVNHILSSAFADGDDRVPRCIQGTYALHLQQEKGIIEDEVVIYLDIKIQPDESGDLRGLAAGHFNLSGFATQGDCTFGYVYDQDLEIELAVTGSGGGPYKIEGDPPAFVEGLQQHALCEELVDLKIEWTVDPFLEEVVFGEFTMPNGYRLEGQYDLHEADAERTTDVHLWLLGAETSAE